MRLPSNTKLPFFAYGLFKPGQLCFFRIRELVESFVDAEVNGILKERDGIPLLVESNHSKIKGALIYFKEGKYKEAYERIVEIEPGKVYRWNVVNCEDTISANALFGKKIGRGTDDLEHWKSWDGKTDPFFNEALKEVEKILEQDSSVLSDDYGSLFRLQMAYMLLWSSIERYAGFRYHLGKRVSEKVYQISKEKCFADSLKKIVTNKREVFSVTDLTKYTLDLDNPDKSIKYYYQVRSNVVHRGKAVGRDFNILRSSLRELLQILKELLNEAWRID